MEVNKTSHCNSPDCTDDCDDDDNNHNHAEFMALLLISICAGMTLMSVIKMSDDDDFLHLRCRWRRCG